MTVVHVAGGLEVDLATNEDEERRHQELRDLVVAPPRDINILDLSNGINFVGGSNTASIDLTDAGRGVPMGRLWDIRRVSLLGPNDVVSAATRVTVFKGYGSARMVIGGGGLIDWNGYVGGTYLPAATAVWPILSFAKGQLLLQGGDHLLVWVAGTLALGNYEASASGFDVPDSAAGIDWLP